LKLFSTYKLPVLLNFSIEKWLSVQTSFTTGHKKTLNLNNKRAINQQSLTDGARSLVLRRLLHAQMNSLQREKRHLIIYI
jgi:hypothetical protein